MPPSTPKPPSRRQSEAPRPDAIKITGARVHNLKAVRCDIPMGQLTVITGPSGSGKSSLAFDTLFAEGQRRFIESMSSYARQFLARIEKPDVEKIEHILPAIALEQKNSVKNARATVGTSTEIDDYLRVLMASVGKTHCPACGNTEVNRLNPLQIERHIMGFADGSKLLLLSPVFLRDVSLEELSARGFVRVYHQKELIELTPENRQRLSETLNTHEPVLVVVDRLIVRAGKGLGDRLLESIRSALEIGNGKIEVHDLGTNDIHVFQTDFACTRCHAVYPEPFPNMFSFNSPLGACPACEGFGRIIGLDLDKVIPNKTLSLKDHAVHPFSMPSNEDVYRFLLKEAKKRKIRVDVPYCDLNDAEKAFVIDGAGQYEGVRGFFDWLETKKYKVHVRVMLAKYRGYYPCPECRGSRLQANALNVFLHPGKGGAPQNFHDLQQMPVDALRRFFAELGLSEVEASFTERLLREIATRLDYLAAIGLSYLTLGRQSRTLSGGEAQRINLSAALGSSLTDTLYVLDEPTVGLHARDTDRLLTILKSLCDHGNTVVVVEHDPDVMQQADHVIDMGPRGGEAGGRIVFEGDPKALLDCPVSLTGQYLKQPPPLSELARQTNAGGGKGDAIEIAGARGNNLKNLTVRIPKNTLVAVTGVSGSGKSTLIKQTLFAHHEHRHARSLQLDAAPVEAIRGLEDFADVLLVDQSPPGRSARSNPVTYVKAYDDIRALFAASRKAATLGITASDFSFNSSGGRCETCEGLGTVTIDMQFMADVTMTCPECQGRRFNPNVLSVELDHPGEQQANKNIDDVLNLTVDDAVAYFKPWPRILRKLAPLQAIGLGYLKLGQSTATLSGGEAQRLKLASYLKGGTDVSSQPMLFLFDEPTTGLHMADIALLVAALRQLLGAGHSVIVIEHNIDFIAQCDYLIDLGPEGGERGGQIVAQGSIAEVIQSADSETGRYLAQRLNLPTSDTPAQPRRKKATAKR